MGLTRSLASHKKLVACLVPLGKKHKPLQIDPIFKLLSKLNDLATIFINCLDPKVQTSEADAAPERLARDVIKTHNIVQTAIEEAQMN